MAKGLSQDPSRWELQYFPEIYEGDRIVIVDGARVIAEFFYSPRVKDQRNELEAAALAEFVMRACRAYQPLVAVLRDLLPVVPDVGARAITAKRKASSVLEEAGG